MVILHRSNYATLFSAIGLYLFFAKYSTFMKTKNYSFLCFHILLAYFKTSWNKYFGSIHKWLVFKPQPRKCFHCFWERERGGEREKNHCEIEASVACLLYTFRVETKSSTQVCRLTGNWTHNHLVTGWCPKQLRHTSQVHNWLLLNSQLNK